ncbi:O-antigen ligase family protein [Mycolicibacterium vaccae]|uniref:O-antigen ligase family protein n=1 Tax=Mycolicibacterium vaccae TaxID=1810 RepID=UPI003D074F5E
MTAHVTPSRARTNQKSAGWIVLAVAVFLSLLVGEYRGPIIGIAFAIASTGVVMVWTTSTPIPRFPKAGYWLVGILGVGLGATVLANLRGETVADIDLQRDLGISLSYILIIVVGYLFASSREPFRILMIAVIAAGMLISTVHLVKLTTVLSSGVTDLYLFRLEAGRGSITQFTGLCACLLLRHDLADRGHRRFLAACAALQATSMCLTLSRGLIILLIVLALGMAALTFDWRGKLSADPVKMVIAAGSAIVTLIGCYIVINLFLPAVHDFIDEFFITRVLNSSTEVAATNLQTRTQIADNYRAFELDQTLAQFDQQPLYAQMVGQGWGSVVRFGLETASTKSHFTRTEASFLHNGYAYYLMKVGVVGVTLYAGFLAHCAYRAVNMHVWSNPGRDAMRRKVLLTLVVALVIGTITTGGLGYPATYLGLAVLLGACYGPLWSDEGLASHA